MPTVTNIRKETSSNGTHRHIEGVCTTADIHYTRREVVASMAQGNEWTTRSASGNTAKIRPIEHCTTAGCQDAPYITTRPDSQKDDNLENLPPC